MTIATNLVDLTAQLRSLADILDGFANGPASGDGSTVTNEVGATIKSIARLQDEVLAGADIGQAHTWTARQAFTGGVKGSSHGRNANGGWITALYPDAQATAQVAAKFGGGSETGFIGTDFFYGGLQTWWPNKAQTFMKNHRASQPLVNTANVHPGKTGKAGAFRGQQYDADGDFTTFAGLYWRLQASYGFWFQCTATSGSPTLTDLTVDFTSNDYLEGVLGDGVDVIVLLHSEGGIGIPGDAKIADYDSLTITLDKNATADIVDGDFSLCIISPAEKTGEFGSDYRTNIHRPFTASIDNGTAVLYDIKFNPERLGLTPQAKANGASIPTDARIINYTSDGVNHAIEIGNRDTGIAVNGTGDHVGATITIDTLCGTFTCTGDVSSASSWITNLSVNPIERTLLQYGGGAYARPKWESTKLFQNAGDDDDTDGDDGSVDSASSADVSSITSTSITMDANAIATGTFQATIDLYRARWGLRAKLSGRMTEILTGGWIEDLLKSAVWIQKVDLYHDTTQVLDVATHTMVAPIWVQPSTAPAAPSSGWRIYCDSGDGNLKAKHSGGTIVTLGPI